MFEIQPIEPCHGGRAGPSARRLAYAYLSTFVGGHRDVPAHHPRSINIDGIWIDGPTVRAGRATA